MSTVTLDEVWASFKETDRKFQETERLLKEQSRETDRKFQETERLLKEQSLATEKKLNKLEELFTSQWGKLMESLGVCRTWGQGSDRLTETG